MSMKEKQNAENEQASRNPDAEKPKKKKLSASKRFFIIFLIIVLVFLPVSNAIGYEVVFHFLFRDTMRDNEKNEEDEAAFLEEKGLVRAEFAIEGDHGRHLQGYLYTKEDVKDLNFSSMVVLSHGIGNGHIAYLDLIGELLELDDTAVFAYDATGCGRSDGEATGGLPQGVRDLDSVLNFIAGSDTLKAPKITLLGHSWGAYSAGSVLEFHPEVRQAVLLAGFNGSENMLQSYSQKYAGPIVYLLLPYVELYEMIKFGKFGNASIVRGCEQSSARVMIVQALDDKTVDPVKFGIKYLEKELSDDEDVSFTELPEGGHTLPVSVVMKSMRALLQEAE